MNILDPHGPIAGGRQADLSTRIAIHAAIVLSDHRPDLRFGLVFPCIQLQTCVPVAEWKYSGKARARVGRCPALTHILLGRRAWIGSHSRSAKKPVAGQGGRSPSRCAVADGKWMFIYRTSGSQRKHAPSGRGRGPCISAQFGPADERILNPQLAA